eukprot:980549-Prymnesium_polylepis.1
MRMLDMCVVFRCGGSGLQCPVLARSCAIRAWAVGQARIGRSNTRQRNVTPTAKPREANTRQRSERGGGRDVPQARMGHEVSFLRYA